MRTKPIKANRVSFIAGPILACLCPRWESCPGHIARLAHGFESGGQDLPPLRVNRILVTIPEVTPLQIRSENRLCCYSQKTGPAMQQDRIS